MYYSILCFRRKLQLVTRIEFVHTNELSIFSTVVILLPYFIFIEVQHLRTKGIPDLCETKIKFVKVADSVKSIISKVRLYSILITQYTTLKKGKFDEQLPSIFRLTIDLNNIAYPFPQ